MNSIKQTNDVQQTSSNRITRLREKFEAGIDRKGILNGLSAEIKATKNMAVKGWLIYFKSSLEALAAREVK